MKKSLKATLSDKDARKMMQDPEIREEVTRLEDRMKDYAGKDAGDLYGELMRMAREPAERDALRNGQVERSLSHIVPMLDDTQKSRLEQLLAQLRGEL